MWSEDANVNSVEEIQLRAPLMQMTPVMLKIPLFFFPSFCCSKLTIILRLESCDYSSVLNNRRVTFFSKSVRISLLGPDSLLIFSPYHYSVQNFSSLSSRTRKTESLVFRLVLDSDSVSMFKVNPVSDSESNSKLVSDLK